MKCPHCNKHINYMDYIMGEAEKAYRANPEYTDKEIKEMVKYLYNIAFPEPKINKKYHEIIINSVCSQPDNQSK